MAAETRLSIPRPTAGLAPFEIDWTAAYQAEKYLPTISSAAQNPGTAASLMGIFGSAYSSMARIYGELYQESEIATVKSRKRSAVLILDKAPQIAKEKGLASARSPAGAEDIRTAICYADDEYCALEEYRAKIDAALKLAEIKLNAFRGAFYAVQKMFKNTDSGAGNSFPTDSGTDDVGLERIMDATLAEPNVPQAAPPPRQPTQPTQRVRGFGTPRY